MLDVWGALRQGQVTLRRTLWSAWTFVLLLVVPPCLFRLAFGGTDQDTDMNQGSCFADSCSARVAAYNSGVLKDGEDPAKVPDSEWEKRLTPDQYYVARQRGTERPFTGNYYDHHETGIYTCSCCGAELFDSSTKYESGSGWPSFFMAKGADGRDDRMTNVSRHTDDTHGMRRVEVTCKKCAAHLGHVFEDGPEPTGLRYCINSASLGFKPAE